MGQWQSSEICSTPACVHAASHVLSNMIPDWSSMDPCTDFDKMVCYGAFENDGDNGGTFADLQGRTSRVLRKILESSTTKQATDFKSTFLTARSAGANVAEYNFDMLRTAYDDCMDTTAITKAGVTPLTNVIVSVNEIWAVSPTDLTSTIKPGDYDNLHAAVLALEQLGIPIFHDLCSSTDPVMADPLSSKRNTICWTGPRPYLASNTTMYFDETAMDWYRARIGKVFAMAYPDISSKSAQNLGAAVADFEANFVKIALEYQKTLPNPGDLYSTVKNVSVADIAKQAPVFGFDTIIAGLTPANEAPALILLDSPAVWPTFSKLVAQHSPAAIHGYVLWRAINSLLEDVSDPQLNAALNIEVQQPRWEICVAKMDTMLRHIKDHYFLSATYTNLTMQAADKMTTNIRAQQRKRFGELAWMSDESRARAIKKADNMIQNIGFPTENPDIRSSASIADYYAGLNFTAGAGHFYNSLAARRHATAKSYGAVSTPPNRRDIMNVAEVNAFYTPSANAMIIPAGISQLPIFHYHLPDYALYGGLGSVIGHEISHGFDNNGRLWNEDHEYRTWWDNNTIAGFEQRAQCFIDQYSGYIVDIPGGKTAHVNGAQTLAENLADAGGIRAAYAAWVEERKSMPNTWNQKLPGLEDFTPEQLFFIYQANMWCSAVTPAQAAQLLATDVHSPNLLRIKGMTENSADFKKAFQCPDQKPKCELW
ncbi:hypothetical protein B0J18DRAFT_231373 [Chaetomium sp. MPI-SDFR-AT-0129]|nr:hypothetical protein B0J18DRAFT_231373 [Chaetomium sp. MPI-SDFR-AT-0129]